MNNTIEIEKFGTLGIDGSTWYMKSDLLLPWLENKSALESVIFAVSKKGLLPSEKQITELTALLKKSATFKSDIENAIFSMLEDTIEDYIEDEPDLSEPADIWKYVIDAHMIWVDEDSVITISFRVNFDEEHELNIIIVGGLILEVQMG